MTHSLTHSLPFDLIDVTPACEDGNSKLVEVVTVVDLMMRNCRQQFGADLEGEVWS